MIEIRADEAAEMTYIRLNDEPSVNTIEYAGAILDFDKYGIVCGIEIFDGDVKMENSSGDTFFSAFPSIAAIIIYAMKLHSKKPKPFIHEHIWQPWEPGVWTDIVRPGTTQAWDRRLYYERVCLDCGDREYKYFSKWKNKWGYPKEG